MPVKVTCPKCKKVLNAPDAARGKAVKCSGCESRVSVPDEDGVKASSKVRSAKKSAAAADDDFLSNLTSETIEDQKVRVCPKCGIRVDEDDEQCPACHVDLSTGQRSAATKKRLSRKGPDPREFYGEVFGDAFNFLKRNWGLALKMAMGWSILLTITSLCVYMVCTYCYGDIPPSAFWAGLGAIAVLGILGNYLQLSIQIVGHALEEKDKRFKPQLDIYSAMAYGVALLAWPLILISPFAWFPPVILLPLICFPFAVVHMTRQYPYKAYIAVDMAKVAFMNFGPSMFFWAMFMFLFFLPAVAMLGLYGVLFLHPQWMDYGWVQSLARMLSGVTGAGNSGYMYQFQVAVVGLTGAALLAFVLSTLVAFPAVFMMRANGLLGYYCRNRLDLVTKISKHSLCGFWPRYLQYLADEGLMLVMFAAILGVNIGARFALPHTIFSYLGPEDPLSPLPAPIDGVLMLTYGILRTLYYASFESSAFQGTLGMRSMGLKTITEAGGRISFGTGFLRAILRNISASLFGLPFILAAFTEKKQALHDSMTKTQVVWEGE